MILIPLSAVEVGTRQRSTIAGGPLNDLKDSILNVGLLNPPVCWHDPVKQKWILVAGERRYRAISDLAKAGHNFHCSDKIVAVGQIPITPLGDYLNETSRFEAELDENVRREDLEWPDRMRAYAALHAMRQAQNPQHTVMDTAKELAPKIGAALDEDGKSRSAHRTITQAVLIAQHLDNPKIALARNPAEAQALIYKQEEEKILAALIRRKLSTHITVAKPIEIRHDDLTKLLPKLDANTFDLIIADPPYGIDASGAGFRARSVHHHNYRDDVESAQSLAQTILTEGFRLTKPRANIFIFCDIDLFPFLRTTASNMGWTSFRRPLIWVKSESEGLAPWGGQGPRITTEFIFYATKGQRGLNASPVDVFDDRRVARAERLHAAEKPTSLFKSLISCSSLPGDRLLDPCCGSGASLVAARELNRQALGIEKDEDYYNTALTNVFGKETLNAVDS